MAAGTLVSSGSSGSMPTGSGSERLCRAYITGLNNDWQEILSGKAGHIYTVISIIFTDTQGAAGTIQLLLNDLYLLSTQSVGSTETFVWSDKFVMEEDDDLDVYNTCTNGDWIITYIDQDWT